MPNTKETTKESSWSVLMRVLDRHTEGLGMLTKMLKSLVERVTQLEEQVNAQHK